MLKKTFKTMINITEDIHSLTDFKKNTNEFIHDLKKSGRPAILTVNGKAELVVMDAGAFHKMQEEIEFEDSVAQVKQSLKDFEEGNYLPAEEVFDQLREIIKRNQEAIAKKNTSKKTKKK
jgi:PHD/YefM family antitoxin component YafN of YafNO toxin-antitoxin module